MELEMRIKELFMMMVVTMLLLNMVGCAKNTYTTVYYGNCPQNETPETARQDYNYVYYYYNGNWHNDKLLWFEITDNNRIVQFAIETEQGEREQHCTSIENVDFVIKNDY